MEILKENPILPSDKPRIAGTEMEHASRATMESFTGAVVTRGSVGTIVQKYMDPEIQRVGHFLSNGDRSYEDVGDHMEQSTAECDSFWEVIKREFNGGQLVFGALQNARADDRILDFSLEKIVTNGVLFWGYHENYLIPATHDRKRHYLGPLALHMATRQVFAGAGDLQKDGVYHMSQKMRSTMTLDEGTASSANTRPLIDQRDENHASSYRYRRQHITSGDPHMQEYPAWLQMVTTSIVMRMVEAGVDMSDLYLLDSVAAARSVDLDLNMNQQLPLEDPNRRLTALEIQRRLALRAYYFSQKMPLTAEEQLGIQEWLDITDDLKYRPDTCADRVEWIAKRDYLEMVMAKKSKGWKDQGMVNVAQRWTDLDPEKGYGLRLSHKCRPMPIGEDSVDPRTPPATTRANLRGRAIEVAVPHVNFKYPDQSPIGIGANWATLTLRRRDWKDLRHLKLNDPYQTRNEVVEAFIEYALAL